MIYLLTVLNAIILAVVAYLFYSFRKAMEASGVRQVDEYLHELEGSVAQLTEQFERSSTKISKDLLRKTTELQALIGECDAKLVEANRARAASAPAPAASAADVLARRSASAARPATRPSDLPAAAAPRAARPESPAPDMRSHNQLGVPTVPPAVAARRLSASEAIASQARPRPIEAAPAAHVEAPIEMPAPVATQVSELETIAAAELAVPAGEGQAIAAGMGQPNEKYRLIFLLASEGMDAASIAKHTNLTRSEVEMLLDLRRQGKI
jgi:hypothetical protein